MARIDRFIFNAIAHARIRHYLVVYDISSDRERNLVSDIIGSYGVRVQYSVFECRLTRKSLTELLVALKRTPLETGCVCIYRVEKGSKPLFIGIRDPGTINLDDACIII